MENKSNSLSRVKRHQREKVLRFSIRKYSFGAASVAVAALMFLGARVVSADSVTPVDQPHVEALTQDTSPIASQDKEEPTSSVKVDTAVASQLVTQLKDQLHVKEAANKDLLVVAKEELVKAEQTLADSKVSQEEVDALVARLTNVLDQLRAVKVSQGKEDKNGESTQEATPEIKPEVAKPTPEISAKPEETSENTNAEQLEKAKASLKVSIDRLEQAIAQTPENDLTREILEKAIAQVAVAKSAFGGVEVSLRDVEDMNRVIKHNESSVMIARNRLTSGRNDVRNGAAIPVGTTLRADAGATYDNAVGLYFTKEGDGSGYPAGTMLFRDRNQQTADNQRVKNVKDDVKVDVTKNGDTYNWVIEFDSNPENHQNAHAWFTIPTGHTLVDGSASFGSYWGGSGGRRRIETQGRVSRNLDDIFKLHVSSTAQTNFGTPGGAIEWASNKAPGDAFWKSSEGTIKTLEDIISNPSSRYWNRTGGARTSTEKDVQKSDYLKDWLIRHTQKVYHFEINYRGQTKDSTPNFIYRFQTKAAEGIPLMYAAGMRSYEFSTHRNDMQWYGLPYPKVTGADKTIEKGKEIRLEFTTKDNLAGFSNADPKLGYNPATSITLEDSKLKLENQKVEVQKVSNYEHKLIITGRVASEPSDTGYQVKVKSVNNVGQSAVHTATVKVTQSITPTLELNQDSKTGNVTVTPQRPGGGIYPTETKVEIPGKDGKPIIVTIDKEGKGKVPNSDLPDVEKTGTGKITEPNKPAVEVPNVTTPAKITPRDTIAPTITANDTTVTKNEPITPISVTAVDNTDGVGMRDNNPIEVTGLPAGLTYANNRITGTPTGAPGNSTVTIKAYDKNGNMATKTITITVRSQADTHNPTGTGLTVNQNHTITDAELKAKVSNYAPGTLSIVSRPSTATAGNAGNAVVKVTYPDGTFDNVNVPVTVTDVTGPTITANNATVTSREQITPIPVTAVDNTGGVGMRQNNPIEVTGLPAGLTYANNQITGTPTGPAGNTTVTIKAYDRNNRLTTKTITITVRSQADVHNPTGAGLTVNQNHTITDAELKAKVSNAGPGTLSIVSRPSTANAGNAGNAVVKVTYPDGTFDNVNVPVTVTDVTGPTITAESATVTKNESITPIPVTAVDNTGGVGMRDNNPIEVTNLPAGLRYANNQITGTPTAGVGYYTVTIKAYDKNNRSTTKQIRITVRSQADAHNPTGTGLTVNQNHIITDAELKAKVSNFAPGTLSIVSRPSTATAGNAGNAVVKVTYPDGTFDNVNVPVTVTDVTGPTITADSATVTKNESITPIPVTAVDNTGGVGMRDNNPIEVTNLPAGLRYANNQITGTPTAGVGYYTVTIKAYDKNNRSTTKQIRITVQDQASKYTPTGATLTVPYNHNITDDEVKAKVQNFAPGTLTVQSKPSTNTSGNVGNAVVKVTYPDGSHDTVNVPVVVGRPNKDDYTPKYNDGSGKPGASVDIPVGEANGKTIPSGTTYTSKTPGVVTVDDKGKVTVTIPADKNPGDEVTGKVLVRYPDGSEEEVPVKVTVTPPEQLTPTIELKPDPKTGDVTVTPKKPDGSTFPPGTKVEIPGEDGPITVEIGQDGKGKVPNDKLPKKDVPGTGKITEPGKPAVEVPNVTTPAKVTPATPETEKPGKIEITQQPNGNAIVTPKKPDGSTYPPKTTVEIPGENGTTITVTIGDNGSGEVPNDNLPKTNVPGTGKVTEPNKKPSQPVDVTTPARKTPTVELKPDPKTGDVTVTPKKPDGSTFPPGTKVEIPGEDGPITVEIGQDGKGKVPNDKLPKKDVPGTGKITEPGKPAVEVPNVTTPAKVTPATPETEKPVAPVTPDTPVKPDTNGGSGQDTPAPATPTPNADQVDTKTTVDNGANSNDSQNVLPNTGTESNAALASLGLLGLLSGFGLVARKKKED